MATRDAGAGEPEEPGSGLRFVGRDAAPVTPGRRRRWPWVAGTTAAVVAVAGAAYLVLRDDLPDPPRLPDRFGAYTVSHDAEARTVTDRTRRETARGLGSDDLLDATAVRLYRGPRGTVLLVLAIDVDAFDDDSVATGDESIDGDDPDRRLEQIEGGVAGSAPFGAYPPGPAGGAVRCGHPVYRGVTESMCLWTDDRLFGLVVTVTPKRTNAQTLRDLTLLRAALP